MGRRLASVALILTILGAILIATRLDAAPDKVAFLGSIIAMVLPLSWAVRASTPARPRGWIIVGVLLIVTATGAARYGIQSGPTLAMACAVVVAVLLLGRRAMIATLAVGLMIFAATGVLMVNGLIAPPPLHNIAPSRIEVWLRAGLFSVLYITIIAVAVSWTLEQIERSVSHAEAEGARRREAERKALEAQQTELIGQLAAGLAHDFNNHMTVISMWSNVLSDHADPDVRAATREISGSIASAAALTKQMLVLGRRDVRNLMPLSLAAFVTRWTATLRRMLPADIEIVVPDSSAPAWCIADEPQLHQLLLNLSINAKDAMPSGGQLTIRTGERTEGERKLSFVEVSDTGTGMTDEVRLRACDPFFTTKAPGKGSGLGLATAHAIATGSGGALTIESELGRGTKITLLLPTSAPGAEVAARPIAQPRTLRARILLVEDMASVLAAGQRVLRKAGCEVVGAADGDEALRRIEEYNFDLLCSDVVMPGRPTRDVIAAFEAKNPGAPVLLCSGYVAEELVRRGIEEHRYRFLAKPYTPAQLLAIVEELVSEARPVAQASPPAIN